MHDMAPSPLSRVTTCRDDALTAIHSPPPEVIVVDEQAGDCPQPNDSRTRTMRSCQGSIEHIDTSLLFRLGEHCDLQRGDSVQSTQDILEGHGPQGDWVANTGRARLRVTFDQLGYRVQNGVLQRRQLTVLHNVSGFLNPQELTAVMGPSGSGKTTLLNLLAGRRMSGKTCGIILYNGLPASAQGSRYLQRAVGYVEQQPALLNTLTVREMLCYTAGLTMLGSTKLERTSMVDGLLAILGLQGCANTIISTGSSRGISGGEAKRLAVGVALLGTPKLLLLDEPLSGLDSSSAYEVVKLAKQLAGMGMSVCLSVHQPSNSLFASFDRLMVLVAGQLIYFGPSGVGALAYFRSKASRQWKVSGSNGSNSDDAEWLLQLISNMTKRHRVTELAETYKASPLYSSNDQVLTILNSVQLPSAPSTPRSRRKPTSSASSSVTGTPRSLQLPQQQGAYPHARSLPGTPTLVTGSPMHPSTSAFIPAYYPHSGPTAGLSREAAPEHGEDRVQGQLAAHPGTTQLPAPPQPPQQQQQGHEDHIAWYLQLQLTICNSLQRLGVLLRYRTKANLSNPQFWLARMANLLVGAVFLATTWWGVGTTLTFQDGINVSSAIFCLTLAPSTVALAQVATVFHDRSVYAREYQDGLYTAWEYLIAQSLGDNLVVMLASCASTAVAYVCLRLQGSYLPLLLATLLTAATGTATTFLAMACCPTIAIVQAVLPPYVALSILFCGYTIRVKDIPPWWSWFADINWLRYPYDALMVNQFQGTPAPTEVGFNTTNITDNSPFASQILAQALSEAQQTDRNIFLEFFALENASIWRSIGYQAIFLPAFLLLAVLALTFCVRSRR